MPLALSPRVAAGVTGVHVALIVEDDLVVAEQLKHFALSLGHEWMHAVTLADVSEAIARGGYCYVLLDMQIPSSDGAPAMVNCGHTALRLLRERDPERGPNGKHRLQIIVVTSFSRDPEFVTRLLKMDANDFVAKPLNDPQVVPDKIVEALETAKRTDHRDCGADPAASASRGAPKAESAGLEIDGLTKARCSGLLVHGERRMLQDAKFVGLVLLVALHEDAPGAWKAKDTMGVASSAETPSRIRAALKGLLPKGEQSVEADGGGRVRLNPRVTVKTNWPALEDHPEVVIQKLAKERKKPKR